MSRHAFCWFEDSSLPPLELEASLHLGIEERTFLIINPQDVSFGKTDAPLKKKLCEMTLSVIRIKTKDPSFGLDDREKSKKDTALNIKYSVYKYIPARKIRNCIHEQNVTLTS